MITVICSSIEPKEEYKQHIIKTSGLPAIEVIQYTNKNEFSLTEIYNKGLSDATNDIVLFIHDDLIFDTQNWASKLINHFKISDFGIIGLAGTDKLYNGCWWSDKASMCGIVNHIHDGKKHTNNYSTGQGKNIKQVVVIDGLFIAVHKKRIAKKFNEEFKGFHFYDIPFCVDNHLEGVKIGVVTDIRLTHLSIEIKTQKWDDSKKQFESSYQFPINLIKKNIIPTVDLYVLCWNEEKILPYFLKYYEQFVDRIIVIDNESTDNSIKLIKENPKTVIETYKTNSQIRDDAYIEIKNNVWKKSTADIVIVCDMDEFLYHPNLKQYIQDFHDSEYSVVHPVGYDMITNDFNFDYSKQLTELVTEGYVNHYFDKMVMFKRQSIQSINYGYGCHYAAPNGSVKIKDSDDLKLLHFKRLGREYYISKMESYKNRVSDFNIKNNLGFEYRFMNEKHNLDFNEQLSKKIKII